MLARIDIVSLSYLPLAHRVSSPTYISNPTAVFIFLANVSHHFVFLKHRHHVPTPPVTTHNKPPDHQFPPSHSARSNNQYLISSYIMRLPVYIKRHINPPLQKKNRGPRILLSPNPLVPETALQRIFRHMEHPCPFLRPTSETVHSSEDSAPPQHSGFMRMPNPP